MSGDCQAVSTRIQHPQGAVQRGWNRACCGAVLGWAFAKHLDVCDPMTKLGGRQQSNLRKRSSGRCPGLPGAGPTSWSGSMERHQCSLFTQMTHTLQQRLNFVFQNRINHTCRAVAPALGGAVECPLEKGVCLVFSLR